MMESGSLLLAERQFSKEWLEPRNVLDEGYDTKVTISSAPSEDRKAEELTENPLQLSSIILPCLLRPS